MAVKRGGFTIPTLEEMKEANKMPSDGGRPKLFQSASRSTGGASEQPRPLPIEATPTCDAGEQTSTISKSMDEAVTNTCPAGTSVGEGSGETSATPTTESTPAVPVCRPHAIIVNPVQRKNPVMKHIRNVPWEVGDVVPDFVLGRTTCALFLSVHYHTLHPDYIHSRLKELGKAFDLRVLLVLVDVSESQRVLQELARIAILANLTLMVAWSYEEAGRYLETYKAYENKPPDLLMERSDGDMSSLATESLTTIRKVNRTDAATLLNTFKTMEGVITASKEELILCPGLGQQKAQKLFDLFHEPFIRPKKT